MGVSRKTLKTTVGSVGSEVLAYTVGEDPTLDLALIDADCAGSAAHATMLARMPGCILTAAECRAVIRELVAIMRRARAGAFAITLADQDVHLAVERTLTEKLGDTGKKVHTFRSRNDQVAVDLRLFIREQVFGLTAEAAVLAEAFLAFARRHAAVPMAGRTHLQPAMPSSVGLWASAHAESLLDDMRELASVLDLNDQCPLGSAASYGVPAPIDRRLTARLLGFTRPVHNVLYANNVRGKHEARVLAACGQVMLTLSRAAEDLILFTMPEFGYFRLPVDCTTGSSIMPQKRNPDVCELVRSRAARVLARAACAAEIGRGLPSGYNRDLQDTKGELMDGLAVTRGSLRAFLPLVCGLEADPAALRKGFTPDVFATDVALEQVAAGVPFRDAYHHVKTHLAELANRDPVKALRLKTHYGAPAGLDFAWLAKELRTARAAGERRRRAVHAALSRLLGVPYPVV
jgi:argininosuccinate lyase